MTPMLACDDDVLSIDQVAKLLGLGRNRTGELIKLGFIPHTYRGKRIVLYRDEVLTFKPLNPYMGKYYRVRRGLG